MFLPFHFLGFVLLVIFYGLYHDKSSPSETTIWEIFFLELFPKHRTNKSKMKLFFGLDVEGEHAEKNAGKLWKCSRERIF